MTQAVRAEGDGPSAVFAEANLRVLLKRRSVVGQHPDHRSITAHFRAEDRDVPARGVEVCEDSIFGRLKAGIGHTEKVEDADVGECAGVSSEGVERRLPVARMGGDVCGCGAPCLSVAFC